MKQNKILALKYRPQAFKDLIGQEIISETILSGIKNGKTPNAYLLTGIRGVGKTTIARLIAKALNCEKNLNKKIICDQENFCNSCSEIISSSHIDVLEMDAASKTGIDDVRELIENSKYSPTSAQFKIFIIDEVHMLSKQAFNGLLKTLEEPPSRLKFILATTEVRKIPVTILSRCQRFDLKRVDYGKMQSHLKNIAKKENGNFTDEAINLITKASEGSVRDGVSLLDRALIFQNISSNKEISGEDIRKMLGLADRSRIINLFKEILLGNESEALNQLEQLIESGLDTKNFLNDILEILYFFSRKISLGSIDKKDLSISESEIELIDKYSDNLDIQDIGLFWQLTIKTIDDIKLIANENLSLKMYVIQLMHLKSYETNTTQEKNLTEKKSQVKSNLQEKKAENEENIRSEITIKSQLKNTDQIKTSIYKQTKSENLKSSGSSLIKNFHDIVKLADKEKEVDLKYDLERNVKLVSFSKGKIDISFNEKLNKNFIKNLTEKLLEWTNERWIISLSKIDGSQTIYEKKIEEQNKNFENEKNSEVTKKIIATFPDAKLIKVEENND